MSTVCFDIKRVDKNYVCIQHADLNKFEYSYHLPFGYYNIDYNGKHYDHPWTTDEDHQYMYVLVGEDSFRPGIERILAAYNLETDCEVRIQTYEQDKKSNPEWYSYTHFRIIKLPAWNFSKKYSPTLNEDIIVQSENDMGDQFLLKCPINLNKIYEVYGTYDETTKPGDEKRLFEWHDPQYLTSK